MSFKRSRCESEEPSKLGCKKHRYIDIGDIIMYISIYLRNTCMIILYYVDLYLVLYVLGIPNTFLQLIHAGFHGSQSMKSIVTFYLLNLSPTKARPQSSYETSRLTASTPMLEERQNRHLTNKKSTLLQWRFPSGLLFFLGGAVRSSRPKLPQIFPWPKPKRIQR